MPAGGFIGVLFFLLLAVAAITSVVGLMEPIGVWIGERFNWSRHRAALALTLTLVVASLLSALSYNELADVRVAGHSLGAVLDFVPSQVLLPMGGLLTATFAGWFLTRAWCRDELRLPSDGWLSAWRGTMRFLVTPAVLLILLTGILQN
jgi:NSS family neurotransmitter:Na+ symporter